MSQIECRKFIEMSLIDFHIGRSNQTNSDVYHLIKKILTSLLNNISFYFLENFSTHHHVEGRYLTPSAANEGQSPSDVH